MAYCWENWATSQKSFGLYKLASQFWLSGKTKIWIYTTSFQTQNNLYMFLNLKHLFQFCECKCAHLNYNVSIFYYHHTESTDSSGKKQTISTTKVIFLFIFWQDVVLVLLLLVLGCSFSTVTARQNQTFFIVVFERLSITLHIY